VDGGILLAMSEQVAEAIRGAIRDHGPISFAEFMERALYGPGGFYEDPPVGASGDFVTSPHVHPVFGAMLGTAVTWPVRISWANRSRSDSLRSARRRHARDAGARSTRRTRRGLRGDRRQPWRASALTAIDGVRAGAP
jgi:hypothetical protein